MPTPKALTKLATTLLPSNEQASFIDCIMSGSANYPALVWLKARPATLPFTILPSLSWQPEFVDRLSPGEQPGRESLHEEGAYYVLDASSVFAGSIVGHLSLHGAIFVDLCSAPGGKSILAWRAYHPSLLVCNDTISKRIPALISNLTRCSILNTIVVSSDSSYIAERFDTTADLVIVDAPCSGQSLLVRGKGEWGAFHPSTINMNANRQRRIMANAARVVAPGGYLAYMTCTFSREENEGILIWFKKKFPAFELVSVAAYAEHQSHLTELPCYRLWPQAEVGGGAFAALFKNSTVHPNRREVSLADIRVLWES